MSESESRTEYTTSDPEPWVAWGVRYAARVWSACRWDPRPEYETEGNTK